jgi:hypothetical protein
MMATAIDPPLAAFGDPSPPQSLLLYPSLVDQTTLADLAQFVRARNYHAYRDAVTRVQLNQVILANALIARLAGLLYYTQTLLVRLVVNNTRATDNTSDFCTINQAAQELQKSITNTYTSPIENVQSAPGGGTAFVAPKSFLEELSPTASTTLLGFLSSVRSDQSLLCSRLLQANERELDVLVSWKPHHHAIKPKIESHATRHTTPPMQTVTPADHIISFHRHDPLYVLTSVIFSSPYDHASLDHRRCLGLWSSALAKLIDNKRGDQVVMVVMDIWTNAAEWQAAEAFEIAILRFLQEAAKLEPRDKFEDAFDDEPVGSDPEMVELFDKTLVEILNILSASDSIPLPALELVQSTFTKCPDKAQATQVLFTEWFIQHFLSQAICSPEVCRFDMF